MNESLYELTKELAPLEMALTSGGGDVTDNPELLAHVTYLLDKVDNKIDAYGMYATNLKAMAEAIRDEEMRLAERRRRFENDLKRLKEAAKMAMEMRGIKKIEGQKFTVSLQRNGGKPAVTILTEDLEKIPAGYKIISFELDKERIRQDLLDGKEEAMKIARFEEVGTSVRIY